MLLGRTRQARCATGSLLAGQQPRPNLVRARDYRGVNQEVWSVFIRRYGGQPAICRYELIFMRRPRRYRHRCRSARSKRGRRDARGERIVRIDVRRERETTEESGVVEDRTTALTACKIMYSLCSIYRSRFTHSLISTHCIYIPLYMHTLSQHCRLSTAALPCPFLILSRTSPAGPPLCSTVRPPPPAAHKRSPLAS